MPDSSKQKISERSRFLTFIRAWPKLNKDISISTTSLVLLQQRRFEATRQRGRSPMRWTNQIKASVSDSSSVHKCTRRASIREKWQRVVKLATNTWSDDKDHSIESDADELELQRSYSSMMISASYGYCDVLTLRQPIFSSVYGVPAIPSISKQDNCSWDIILANATAM